jgi:hypothetical protein
MGRTRSRDSISQANFKQSLNVGKSELPNVYDWIMLRVFMLALIFACFLNGEDIVVPETASSPEAFAPAGWTVRAKAEGDLNRDNVPDAAVVFVNPEESHDGSIPRLLVIAFRQPDGTWKRSAVSEKEVYCKECGGALGDPFLGIVIEHGTLLTDEFGGSAAGHWEVSHQYRFEDPDWIRIGETEDDHSGFATDRNLITGRVVETQHGKPPRIYYELRVASVEHPPGIDGTCASGYWKQKRDLHAGGERIRVSAVVSRNGLHLWADRPVKLRTSRGKTLRPDEEQTRSCYEARFGFKTLNGGPDAYLPQQFWVYSEKSQQSAISVYRDSDEDYPIKLK